MANNFSKQETVMFEQVLEGFDDLLVIAKNVETYTPPAPQEMERSNDRFWRPQPYIAVSYDGIDQTGNFGDITQLSVPVGVGQHKSVPGTMSAYDLRDPVQLERYGRAAKMKLASDVNRAIFNAVCTQGSIIVPRTGPATGFDDFSALDAAMTEIGVPVEERKAFLSVRDYNNCAGNLAKPQTSGLDETMDAFRRAYLGPVAGFETFKNDQTYWLEAAAATGVTITGANQYYTPVGSETDADGNTTNVDNRYQTINITVTSGTVKVGDAFTIAGVNSVHMESKADTGQPQTFRVTKIISGNGGTGSVQITPPIISGQGGTRAEKEYQNVTATPAAGAAVTFLNIARAPVNPAFVKSAVELIPGSFAVNPEDGWHVMEATTDFGLQIVYARQGTIDNFNVKYRWDIRFGVGVLNPQMCGALLFNQTAP